MFLKSCGTSMNAVHESHQKRFFKKSVISNPKRVFNEIVLTL